MTALSTDGPHVNPAIVTEGSEHPHVVGLAIESAGQTVVGNGSNRRPVDGCMPHHLAQRWPGQQFEADERADRVAGQSEDGNVLRARREQTERERLGRLDGYLHPLHVGNARQHRLDHVVVAHADAAAGDDCIAARRSAVEHFLQHRLVVAHDSEVDGLATRVAHCSQQHGAVALANLARLQRRSVVDQLVAGTQHRDPNSGNHRHHGRVHAGQHTRNSGGDEGARRVQRRTCTHVVANPAHRNTSRGRHTNANAHGAIHTAVTQQLGVLHHHDRIGPRRHRRAGHDANGLTEQQHAVGVRTGSHFADDRQIDRYVRERRSDDRIAINGAVGERWHILGGDHCGRQNQAGCLAAWHVDRRCGRAAVEHGAAGLGDVDHAATVP